MLWWTTSQQELSNDMDSVKFVPNETEDEMN